MLGYHGYYEMTFNPKQDIPLNYIIDNSTGTDIDASMAPPGTDQIHKSIMIPSWCLSNDGIIKIYYKFRRLSHVGSSSLETIALSQTNTGKENVILDLSFDYLLQNDEYIFSDEIWFVTNKNIIELIKIQQENNNKLYITKGNMVLGYQADTNYYINFFHKFFYGDNADKITNQFFYATWERGV